MRNVGEGPLGVIFKAREEAGPLKSWKNSASGSDRAALNKRVLESLIKCGAMDGMPGTRRQELAILEQALSAGSKRSVPARPAKPACSICSAAAPAGSSVQSLPLPIIPETPQDYKEQLAWEKELLGMCRIARSSGRWRAWI